MDGAMGADVGLVGTLSDEPIVFPKRRRRVRDSGELRVRKILDAAVWVIGTEGPSAVTHRSVASVADVPLGSMTYYFTDRDDLMTQAMLHAMEVESKRLNAIVDGLTDQPTVDSSIRVLTEMFFDKTVADPLYDLALFELFLDATRNATARPVTTQWSAMIAQLIDKVLPVTDPALSREEAVQLVAALIDGLMLEEASNQSLGLKRLSAKLRIFVERIAV